MSLAKLGTAKSFLSGGRLELQLVSLLLPKHLLSCALPFPRPAGSSDHRNILSDPPQNAYLVGLFVA